jgi:hypothetical protein
VHSTHLPGGEEGGGSIFCKTPDIGLASYSMIPLRFGVFIDNWSMLIPICGELTNEKRGQQGGHRGEAGEAGEEAAEAGHLRQLTRQRAGGGRPEVQHCERGHH